MMLPISIHKEAAYYNALNIICKADYKALKNLKEKYKTWGKAFEYSRTSSCDIRNELEKLERDGIGIVLFEDDEYPALLKHIHAPPFGIYYKGTWREDKECLAIVGTRKATNQGKMVTREWSKECAEAGVVIVSGLAYGMDAVAHEGACDARARTVAVLGCGLKTIYPRQHISLAKRILEHGGVIISEYPYEFPTYPINFVQRNRIIAGLSRGVLVVEAPFKSGTLITAKLGLEENREIWVVPGPVTHPNYMGSHALIKDGAHLVTSVEDILQLFPIKRKGSEGELFLREKEEYDNKEQHMICDILKKAGRPLGIDEIIERTHLTASLVHASLTMLVLNNIILENNNVYEIRYR